MFIMGLIGIIVIGYLVINIGYKTGYKEYKLISELKNAGTYSVIQITNKKLLYHLGDEFASDSETHKYNNNTLQKERTDGYIYFDPAMKTFWIETTEQKDTNDSHMLYTYSEWINLDVNGEIISKKPANYFTKSPGIIIKNEIANFYNWNNKNSKFYVSYFHKQKFNWSSLNPLRGYGSPNGPSEKTYWEGTAYMNLQMNDSIINFKTQTKSTESGYYFNISLCRLNADEKAGELSFLYIDDKYLNNEDKGLYMIMKSPNR